LMARTDTTDSTDQTNNKQKRAKARKQEAEAAEARRKDLTVLKTALKHKCVALAVTSSGHPALEVVDGMVVAAKTNGANAVGPTTKANAKTKEAKAAKEAKDDNDSDSNGGVDNDKSEKTRTSTSTSTNTAQMDAAFVTAYHELVMWEGDTSKKSLVGMQWHLERLRGRPGLALSKVVAVIKAEKAAPPRGMVGMKVMTLRDLGWHEIADHEARLQLRTFPADPGLRAF